MRGFKSSALEKTVVSWRLVPGLALLISFAAIPWLVNGAVRPAARLETQPVPHRGDAADDPAIWIHPVSPELSLILGTDKQGALHIYNLDGSPRQTVGEGTKPNNVDVLYGFKLAGKSIDLALATTRAASTRGMKIWSIDPGTREVSDVTAGGTIPVLKEGQPYGCCAYRSADTGKSFAFVSSKEGMVEQYELKENSGRVEAVKISELKFNSTVEACVADDELGVVYFGEEERGIWKFAAEPAIGRRGELIARTGENGLKRDVEGLAIYYGRHGAGYLIVSSQGNNSFKIYERGPGNRFVQTISPRRGRVGDVEDTDGIAVTSQPSSPTFSKGLFIAQDGSNEPRQNFKLFAWEDIAGTNLLIDTTWSPRR
jgi:3-phytase